MKQALILTVLWVSIGGAPLRTVGLGQDAGASRDSSLLEKVRHEYSGQRAWDVVAFMDRYWRLPGNTGFDASIGRVVDVLKSAGYVEEIAATPTDRLVYRVERRPMSRDTWEPVDAGLTIVGEQRELLAFSTNRNMVAIGSNSTPEGGVVAELIDVGRGSPAELEGKDLAGKIVMGEGRLGGLFRRAVQEGKALGVLNYRMPAYNQPQVHQQYISFSRMPRGGGASAWALLLSYQAHQKLKAAMRRGVVKVKVDIDAKSYRADELTLVAEVRGSAVPDQRFVFSAHVQEPGANDNASGVGAQAEIARVVAALLKQGTIDPKRTITFLWGDEISAIRRYLQEDPARTAEVRWGMSLDMVGEDTTKTGGTFLIEKMPDPSAIWTRGDDQHTEWGSGRVREEDLAGHYFNDFVLGRCLRQAADTGWVVRTNPYEGGSDHVPFLDAGKPGLLLWHFTDVFYHTDGDRIDKVSAETLENVGVSALVVALKLADGGDDLAEEVIEETYRAGVQRLRKEAVLSRKEIEGGADAGEQIKIITAWRDWYDGAIQSVTDIPIGPLSPGLSGAIEEARSKIKKLSSELIENIGAR